MSIEPQPLQQPGPYASADVVGDVTDALLLRLAQARATGRAAPRVTTDLSLRPGAGEEVLYVSLYRVVRNESLKTARRWRTSRVPGPDGAALYSRPPVYLSLSYLVAAGAPVASDAHRLLGWAVARLHDAPELLRRPRRYLLPDGQAVDSLGRPWSSDVSDAVVERVTAALCEPLDLGEALHLFQRLDAPYRPCLSYRAHCAVEGSLVAAPPTQVRIGPVSPLARRRGAATPTSEV